MLHIAHTILILYNQVMIPHIIHYCWFGPSDIMSDEARRISITSWREKMPDYELMLWNENNIDINTLSPFARHAYKNKRWAYVADVVRFQKLYEYGGVYLDTDMLILRDPTPLFIKKENYNEIDISIWGIEDKEHISCGIIACNRNNQLMKDLYNFYTEHYKNNNMNVVIEIPKIVTKFITEKKKENLENIYRGQNKYGAIIYPTEYFYPLPAANKKEDYRKFITNNSYAVHLWNYSWQTPFMRIMNKLQIVKIVKAMIPKGLRPFIVNMLRMLKLN